MADDKRIRIEGLAQLTKDLKSIPFLKQAQILRNANRKAAKRIVIPMLVRANTHSGDKFSRRGNKGKHSSKPFIVVNAKGSKTAVSAGLASAFFHYRFTEFGTKSRTTFIRRRLSNIKRKKEHKRDRRVSSKANRGIMPVTRPFINRVLDSVIEPLFQYLKTEYDKDVRIALERFKRRNK